MVKLDTVKKQATVLLIIWFVGMGSALGVLYYVNEPKNNETLNFHGHFTLYAYHKDGTLFATVDKDNLVVTNGFKGVGNLVFASNSGITPSTYRYVAIGSGSSGPTSGDTALGSECGYSRSLTTTPTYSSGVNTLSFSFTGVSCTATEIGIFDASTTGNMFSRQTYSTITLASTDTLSGTYTVTES